jgi:hypothetical protein
VAKTDPISYINIGPRDCLVKHPYTPIGNGVNTWTAGYDSKIRSYPDLLKPGVISIEYDDEWVGIGFVGEENLKIFYCSDITVNPTYTDAAPTVIDANKNIAYAQINKLGTYALLGKLICPNDLKEIDNYYTPSYLNPTANEHAKSNYTRYFEILEDEDFFQIDDSSYSQIINIFTEDKEVFFDAKLHEADFRITVSESLNTSNATIEVPADGKLYYLLVTPTSTSKIGCDAEYKVSIQ